MQMSGAIATVAEALGEAGAGQRHVVRTIVYVLDMADAHHVARSHCESSSLGQHFGHYPGVPDSV